MKLDYVSRFNHVDVAERNVEYESLLRSFVAEISTIWITQNQAHRHVIGRTPVPTRHAAWYVAEACV